MVSLTFAVAVLSFAALTVEAGGHGQGGMQMQGESGSRMARGGSMRGGQQSGGWQGQGGPQGRSQQGRNQGDDQGYGGYGMQMQQGAGGRQGDADSRRYRANILDDEDVYGYEAKYPNGEALYVNYRNSDARARRGPEFARSNSISARMSGRMGNQGQQDGGYRQQRGAATTMGMGMGMANQGHPQW